MNKSYDPKPTNRVQLNYLPSVLAVLSVIFNIFTALSQPVPPTESTISSDFAGLVDYAKLIDPDRTDKLNALLRELKQKTTASIVVLTVTTGAEILDRTQVESYAARIYTEWNLTRSPVDNTVLFLVTVGEALQSAQPVVYQGQAIREVIDSLKIEKLLDRFFVPAMEQKNYAKGIYETTWALALLLAQSYRTTLSETPPFEGDPLADEAGASQTAIWLLVLVVIAALLWHRFRQGREEGSPFGWLSSRRKKRKRVSTKWDGAFTPGRFRGL